MTAPLASLLDDLSRTLLCGHLEDLPALAARIDAAVSDLPGANRADLMRLRRKAARAEALLSGAARGVRQATARLRAPRAGLTTYGADGRKATVGRQTPGTIARL